VPLPPEPPLPLEVVALDDPPVPDVAPPEPAVVVPLVVVPPEPAVVVPLVVVPLVAGPVVVPVEVVPLVVEVVPVEAVPEVVEPDPPAPLVPDSCPLRESPESEAHAIVKLIPTETQNVLRRMGGEWPAGCDLVF
jgi:hypothetical protein